MSRYGFKWQMPLVVALVLCASCTRHYKLGTVNFDYAPFVYYEDDKATGICIEILDAIAQEQGFTYDLEQLTINENLDALEKGEIQASIAPFTITEDKKVKYDFSLPFYNTGIVFIKSQDNGDMEQIEDLVGKTVAVLANSSMESVLRQYERIWNLFEVKSYETDEEVYEALLYGKVDLAFVEQPVIEYHISQGLMFECFSDIYERSKYAFLFMKDQNRELYEDINVGLAKIINSGKYDEIISRYYL